MSTALNVGQLTYETYPDSAAVGEMYAANGAETKLESYKNPNQAIPFGRCVAKISGYDFEADLPALIGDQLVGITRRDLNKISGEYDISGIMSVVSFGQIWVEPEVDVTADDPVYVRYTGKDQVQTITFAGDLITGNKVNGKINGVSIAEVPFNITNAQTVVDLTSAITATLGSQGTAVKTSDHKITITGAVHGVDIAMTVFAVTEGATQTSTTIAETVASIADTMAGSFNKTADSTTCVLLKNARYLTSTTSFAYNSKKLAVVDIISPLNN